MGCRTVNGADINAEPGTNQQTKDGRGNLAPVTIILPTLAMEAGRDIEQFMALLNTKIYEAKDMLLERYRGMCAQSPDSAKFMYENGTMLGYQPEQGIESALKHGTLVIGQIALAETLELLVCCNHTKPEGMKLAKRIEQLFKERCAEFKQKYHLNFGVYYSPESVGASIVI
jgi:ribonucleoside-triphosphate reductase (formate)